MPGEIAVEEKPDLLTQRWKEDLVTGAQVVMGESWVAASDPGGWRAAAEPLMGAGRMERLTSMGGTSAHLDEATHESGS